MVCGDGDGGGDRSGGGSGDGSGDGDGDGGPRSPPLTCIETCSRLRHEKTWSCVKHGKACGGGAVQQVRVGRERQREFETPQPPAPTIGRLRPRAPSSRPRGSRTLVRFHHIRTSACRKLPCPCPRPSFSGRGGSSSQRWMSSGESSGSNGDRSAWKWFGGLLGRRLGEGQQGGPVGVGCVGADRKRPAHVGWGGVGWGGVSGWGVG